MKRLKRLVARPSYLSRFIAIRDQKANPTQTILIAVHAAIADRYDELGKRFVASALRLLPEKTWSAPIKGALRACYAGSTRELRKVKLQIRNRQMVRVLKYCPMCATTLPSTFDHYLPISRFPEYSVHPLNLVPCCSLCNSTKDDDWLCKRGQRQFLHAYLDLVPTQQFLFVELHETPAIAGIGATFKLVRPRGVRGSNWEVVEKHFERLKLLKRYAENSSDEVEEILAECRIATSGGVLSNQQYLLDVAEDHRGIYGASNWRVALMQGLAGYWRLDKVVRERGL